MSTKAYYPLNEIGAGKVGFSKTRSIIEAAFYGNNVVKVNTLKEAYNLAKNSPGTIVTDMPVYRGEEFGLDSAARVLLFNDGAITGRYATARRIAGEPGVDCDALDKVVMDAVYTARFKKLYHATVYAGLDPEFMVKCHLLIPEGEENILYNWMLNFQYMSDDYVKMYKASKPVGDGKEADIYIFSDPQWIPNEAPGVSLDCLSDPAKKTLCYFNTETNCACILGMRYFGEHKKGTLTMVWAIKSKLWSPNRVDKINAPVNAIFWIMKDPTIPPVVKLKGASLASVMGATLATKRSSAERLAPGVDPNKLVVVPYANPFRTYPLANDYEKFKKLVEEKHVDCYIVNTGDFMGKKVQKEDTLGILEAIVEKRADFHQWGPFSDIEIMDWEGFVPDMQDKNYTDQLKARMNDRVNEIKAFATEKEGYNKLPDDALAAIQKVVDELK